MHAQTIAISHSDFEILSMRPMVHEMHLHAKALKDSGCTDYESDFVSIMESLGKLLRLRLGRSKPENANDFIMLRFATAQYKQVQAKSDIYYQMLREMIK